MSADVTTDIAALSLVLFALVLGGWLGALVDAPLVGEIVVGIALGPSGLDLVPHPDAFVLAGNLALALLVMEGGMSVDVSSSAASARSRPRSRSRAPSSPSVWGAPTCSPRGFASGRGSRAASR